MPSEILNNQPSEAEFVEAYCKLFGSTEDNAREVYRILVSPKATLEFAVGLIEVCEDVANATKKGK